MNMKAQQFLVAKQFAIDGPCVFIYGLLSSCIYTQHQRDSLFGLMMQLKLRKIYTVPLCFTRITRK